MSETIKNEIHEPPKSIEHDLMIRRSEIDYFAKYNKKLSYTVDFLFFLWLVASLFFNELRFNSMFIATGMVLATSTFFIPYFYDKRYAKSQNVDVKITRAVSHYPNTEKVFFVDDVVKKKTGSQTYQVMKVDYRNRMVETDTGEIVPFKELKLLKYS